MKLYKKYQYAGQKDFSKEKTTNEKATASDEAIKRYNEMMSSAEEIPSDKEKNFLYDWSSSKKGQRMLKKSMRDNKNNYNNVLSNRLTRLDNPNAYFVDPYLAQRFMNFPLQRGFRHKFGNLPDDVYINKDSLNRKQTVLHEYSHIQDDSGYYIPDKDEQRINKYKSKANLESIYNPTIEPTEVRARLNTIRYDMVNNDIRNVFNKRVRNRDIRHFNKLANKEYSLQEMRNLGENLPSIDSQAYTDLSANYKKRQIRKMLNKISMTGGKTNI